jgi:hypothetical protein
VSLLGAKLAPLRADDLLDARSCVLLLLHLSEWARKASNRIGNFCQQCSSKSNDEQCHPWRVQCSGVASARAMMCNRQATNAEQDTGMHTKGNMSLDQVRVMQRICACAPCGSYPLPSTVT